MRPTAKTGNNANAFEHSENPYLEFFSKAGSLFVGKQEHYGNESTALSLFKDAWRAGDKELCMKLLQWLRDIRGGSGNRSGFRQILTWLATQYPEWMKANISMIPVVGRWDDLTALYNTECESDALSTWNKGLMDPSTMGLAAKWADRQDYKLRNFMNASPKEFRKMLVKITNVVETPMCERKWDSIDYNKVPSLATIRYASAFKRHDTSRYNKWKLSLLDPVSGNKVNAGAIYPHNLVQLVGNRDSWDLAEAQFKALPNYMQGSNCRPIVINDESASMTAAVAGPVSAWDIALGLALYCSDKIGKDSPFYRKFIPFSDDSKLESWNDKSFGQAVEDARYRGWVGSTNIHAAFDVLINAGKFFNAKPEQMPNVIIICSDMQFNEGVTDNTPVQECITKWKEAGFGDVSIVYWNLAGNKNQPATCKDKNVAMVSGFSPSVMNGLLNGRILNPVDIMMDTVSKYKVNIPNE